MDRRSFLRTALAGAGTIAFGEAFWRAAQAGPATDADYSSYGALGPADSNGLQYPSGFSGRLVARSGTPVGLTPHVWPAFPDGAACFSADDGWILVVNSENPPPADVGLLPQLQDQMGGASAIVFDAQGNIVDAYWILRGTRSNCAGGVTPWGTWLSCEEFDNTARTPGALTSDAGRVWECDPVRGGFRAVEVPTLGRFKHEAAAFDAEGRVYLTEDLGDGCLYRFTPANPTSPPTRDTLDSGVLEALKVGTDGTTVSWEGPIDPSASSRSTRKQAIDDLHATPFNGGEGCYYANGVVLFTTKGDDRVWSLKLGTNSDPDTLEVLYDGRTPAGERVLTGVDNIIVSPHTGNIYVAEDGGNMEVVVIETYPDSGDRTAAPLIRATGPQHGESNPTPIPTASEITGLALSPDCRRLYFNGQRSFGLGVTYEVLAADGKLF
ncbi:MAG: alkaline phosphatase PhoX [Actinomycetota bacterium]